MDTRRPEPPPPPPPSFGLPSLIDTNPKLFGPTKPAKPQAACSECQRNKLKCDGLQPCYYCKWYKRQDHCVYVMPDESVYIKRSYLDSLLQQLEQTTSILDVLYPGIPIPSLVNLSRHDLLRELNQGSRNTATKSSAEQTRNGNGALPNHQRSQHIVGKRGRSDANRVKDKEPERFEYDRSISNLEGTQKLTDDVNALSLPSGRTSYLSASTSTAGLRVLLKIVPRSALAPLEKKSKPWRPPKPNRRSRPGNAAAEEETPSIPTRQKEQRYVDAYFKNVHPAHPLVDEAALRETFNADKCQDPAYLALINMVLALGAVACSQSNSNEDVAYYQSAKSHLNTVGFASGRVETLQALALMAGWYLHYRNRPNMASTLMGAVFRMALSLGLHRDVPSIDAGPYQEFKRRVWWCLVVMGAGEATALGRVANSSFIKNFGVNIPRNIDDQTGKVVDTPTIYSSLIADIGFSRLAVEIQERLIATPTLPLAEITTLDARLTQWYESLPPYLLTTGPCPDWLVQPRASLKWRYMNLRIILYRPALIDAAWNRTRFEDLSSDQQTRVKSCQWIARQSIEDVVAETSNNQFSGWPGVWFMFQASVIPLLSLCTFRIEDAGENSLPRNEVREWHLQAKRAVRFFKDMQPWSIAAKRTYELTHALFRYQKSYNFPARERPSKRMRSSLSPETAALGEEDALREGVIPMEEVGGPTPLGHGQGQMDISDWPLWEGIFEIPDFNLSSTGIGTDDGFLGNFAT